MEAFGRYELRRRLGIGGMAEVYEAVAIAEHGVEKPLVIKRILEEHSTNPSFQEMFVDEARVAMRLSHANVVQVFDFGRADNRYFLAMEHVFGKDLAAVLSEAKRRKQLLPLEFTLFVIGEVAKGLDYAHRATGADGRPLGIVHRDVSPSNVMLSFDGTVKIGDFGIARFENRRGRTMASAIRGKVRYLSPEQVEGVALDGRSDLFALGSIFFEMLTGLPAFDGKTDQEVMAAVRRASYRRPSEIQVVSVGVEPVLAKLLARDPATRYSRGNEVHREVESLATKLRLRSNSSAAKDLLLALFPRSERSSDPNILTLAGAGKKKRARTEEEESTQIRRLRDVNGLPEFIEEKTDEKPGPHPEPETATGPVSTAARADLIAGRYRLLEELGHGALGMVYRATDTTIDEPIAIKLMASAVSASGDIDRFKREILTARRITHPNVLRIFDFGIAGRESYISMELLAGGSLGDLLSRGPVPIPRAVQIVRGVCEGLEAAHAAGIIHRDLKPDNILFDGEGRPKIVDFGLARLTESNVRTVGFSGTPYYMSPESGYGDEITPQSDIYSLGVVFYELFTGALPFKADGLLQITKMHAEAQPPDPVTLRRDLPPAIGAVLLRMLEKDPTRRDRSALTVAEDMEAALKPAPAPMTASRLALSQSRADVTLVGAEPTQVGPIPSEAGSEPTAAERELPPKKPAPALPDPAFEERTSARIPMPPRQSPARRAVPFVAAAVLTLVAGVVGFRLLGGSNGQPLAEATPAPATDAVARPEITPAQPANSPVPVVNPVQQVNSPAAQNTPHLRPTRSAVALRAPLAPAQTERVAIAPATPVPAVSAPVTVHLSVRLPGPGTIYMDKKQLNNLDGGLDKKPIPSGNHVFRFVSGSGKVDFEMPINVTRDIALRINFGEKSVTEVEP